ncbi:MAG: Serine/threonine-protein kinase PknD [Phycisphaerae bacterium]|nr:Serine/threonine-protein kinase PknD [Phycisphaerae bacterium]
MLSAERLKLADSVFQELADAAEEVRAAALRQRLAGDAELSDYVRRLLSHHDRCGSSVLRSPLEGGASTVGQVLDAVEEMTPLPPRIAAYEIVAKLGAGGMGDVYLGQRADGQFEQRVAIKLVKRGMESDEILRRFGAERQVLAGLEHPNIARLIDGGVTDDGRSYLVMEYVDGLPLDRYLAGQRLDLRRRLSLFCEVCAAVQYAHQNLVVHRDLKPGNIFVDRAGRPKLLDFGIAKVLQHEDAALTATQGGPMTPRYASPEQVRGERVTTASDVFALGVILYELLTGRGPYEVEAESRAAYEHAICEQQPRRPSAVATDRSSRRVLVGDLDTIVLKALCKEPARRYPTAEQLADDVRRHLDGLPVRARADTWRYRAGKFIARNRWTVSAAALAALVTVSGAVLSTILYVQAETARGQAVAAQRAETTQREALAAESGTSGAIREFLQGLLTRQNRFGDPQVSQVIDEAVVQLDSGSFRQRPLVEALLRRTIGQSYLSVHRFADAEKQLLRSLEILRTASIPNRDAHAAVALNELGYYYSEAGNKSAAVRHYQAAYDIWHAGTDRGGFYVTLVNNLGEVYRALGRLDEAEPFVRESLELATREYGARSFESARAQNNLGMLLMARSDFAAAEPVLRAGLDLVRQTNPMYTPLALNNLGRALEGMGDLERADACFRESLAICLDADATANWTLHTLTYWGRLLARKGDDRTAEAALREAVTAFRADPDLGGRLFHTLIAWEELAECLTRRGELAEAATLFEEAIEMHCLRSPPDEDAIARLTARLTALRSVPLAKTPASE